MDKVTYFSNGAFSNVEYNPPREQGGNLIMSMQFGAPNRDTIDAPREVRYYKHYNGQKLK